MCAQTRAIWRLNKWLFITALPFKLTNDASQFIAPIFISLLLGVVSKHQSSSLGYSYALLMLTGLVIGTITDSQHFQRVMRTGKSAALNAIRLRALNIQIGQRTSLMKLHHSL